MTELGCSHFNHDTGSEHPGSVSTVADGFSALLVDEDGAEVPVDIPGRLWIRSKCTCIGYWDNQEATAQSFNKGWFDNGDVMKVDRAGYFWFFGRRKQIIVHDGSNICPQEVEDALQNHPLVEHAGVVGVHDLVHGENVIAYLTFRHGIVPPKAGELIEFARTQVGYKAPEEIV